MKKILVLALLVLGVSTASAQMIAPGYGPWGYAYNATPYGWGGMMGGYGPYGYAGNATLYGTYGYYEPGSGMMGSGMMGSGMMGGYGGMGGMMGSGMMGGYGYPYSESYGYPYGGTMGYAPFGLQWTGYGFSSLFWVAIVAIVAVVAYLLGKRRA